MESLDMLANNLANSQTGGYKLDREFYSLYTAPEAADTEFPVTAPVVERQYPLAEVPEALAYVGEGHARGKVVIAIRES